MGPSSEIRVRPAIREIALVIVAIVGAFLGAIELANGRSDELLWTSDGPAPGGVLRGLHFGGSWFWTGYEVRRNWMTGETRTVLRTVGDRLRPIDTAVPEASPTYTSDL